MSFDVTTPRPGLSAADPAPAPSHWLAALTAAASVPPPSSGDVLFVAASVTAPGLRLSGSNSCAISVLTAPSVTLSNALRVNDVDSLLRAAEYGRVLPGSLSNQHFQTGTLPGIAEEVMPTSFGGTSYSLTAAARAAASNALVMGSGAGSLSVGDGSAPRWVPAAAPLMPSTGLAAAVTPGAGGLVVPGSMRFDGSPLRIDADGYIRSDADPSMQVKVAFSPGCNAYVPTIPPRVTAAGVTRLSASNVEVRWTTAGLAGAQDRVLFAGYSNDAALQPRLPFEVSDAVAAQAGQAGVTAAALSNTATLRVVGGDASSVVTAPDYECLSVAAETAGRTLSTDAVVQRWTNRPPSLAAGAGPANSALTLRFGATCVPYGSTGINAARHLAAFPTNGVRVIAGALLADFPSGLALPPLPDWLTSDVQAPGVQEAGPNAGRLAAQTAFRLLRSLEPLLAAGCNAQLPSAYVAPGQSSNLAFSLDYALRWSPSAGADGGWVPERTAYTKTYRPFALAADEFSNAAILTYGASGYVFIPSADVDLRVIAVSASNATATYTLLSDILSVSGSLRRDSTATVTQLGESLPHVTGTHPVSLSNLQHTRRYTLTVSGCNVDYSVSSSSTSFRTLDTAPPAFSNLDASGALQAGCSVLRGGAVSVVWSASDSNDGEVDRVRIVSGTTPPLLDAGGALSNGAAAAALALLDYRAQASCNNPAAGGTAAGAAFAGAATLPALQPTEDHYVQLVAVDRAAAVFGSPADLLALAHFGAEVPRVVAASGSAAVSYPGAGAVANPGAVPVTGPASATAFRNRVALRPAALVDAASAAVAGGGSNVAAFALFTGAALAAALPGGGGAGGAGPAVAVPGSAAAASHHAFWMAHSNLFTRAAI